MLFYDIHMKTIFRTLALQGPLMLSFVGNFKIAYAKLHSILSLFEFTSKGFEFYIDVSLRLDFQSDARYLLFRAH